MACGVQCSACRRHLPNIWQRGPQRPGPRTALGRVAETKQTVHIADVTTEPAYVEGEPIFVAAVNLGDSGRSSMSRCSRKMNSIGVLRHLSSGGAAVHRQADRAGPELRRPGRHRHREHAAAQRAARSRCSSRPPPPTCSRSSAARPSICRRCSTRWSNRRRGCAKRTWWLFRRATATTYRWVASYGHSTEDTSEFKQCSSSRSFHRGEDRSLAAPCWKADRPNRRRAGRPGIHAIRERRSSAAFRTILGVPLLREGTPIGADRFAAHRGRDRSPRSRSSWSDLRRPGGDRDRERAAVRRGAEAH